MRRERLEAVAAGLALVGVAYFLVAGLLLLGVRVLQLWAGV